MYAAQRAVCLAHAGRIAEAPAVVEHFDGVRGFGDECDALPMPTAVSLLEAAVITGARDVAKRLAPCLEGAPSLPRSYIVQST
jgi:hypothetical protein